MKSNLSFRMAGLLSVVILLLVLACAKVKTTSLTPVNDKQQAALQPLSGTFTSIKDSWVAVLDVTNDKINVYDIYAQYWYEPARKMNWSPTVARSYSTAEVAAWGDPRDVRIRQSPWGGAWAAVGGNLATITIQSTGHRQWALDPGRRRYTQWRRAFARW